MAILKHPVCVWMLLFGQAGRAVGLPVSKASAISAAPALRHLLSTAWLDQVSRLPQRPGCPCSLWDRVSQECSSRSGDSQGTGDLGVLCSHLVSVVPSWQVAMAVLPGCWT